MSGNPVHLLGKASISGSVQQVLICGPKFTIELQKGTLELLAMAKKLSSRAPEVQQEIYAAEGVDVLIRCGLSKRSLKTLSYLKEHSLSLLCADKEGSFAGCPS